MPVTGFHSTELRVQVLTLWGVKFSAKQISDLLDLPILTVRNLIKKGQDRGFNPDESLRIKLDFVQDGKRSGRPKEISQAIEDAVIASVTLDRAGREKSSENLAYEAGQAT